MLREANVIIMVRSACLLFEATTDLEPTHTLLVLQAQRTQDLHDCRGFPSSFRGNLRNQTVSERSKSLKAAPEKGMLKAVRGMSRLHWGPRMFEMPGTSDAIRFLEDRRF